MSDELMIIVVGTKADLAGSYPTIPLADAQRNIALWLHELDNPPSEDDPPSTPPPAPPPLHPRNAFSSQAPLVRSRTYSTPLSSTSIPTITTSVPSAPTSQLRSSATASSSTSSLLPQHPLPQAATDTSLSARMRAMSNKLAPSSSSAAGNAPLASPRPTSTLISSATMPDLSAYTLAGLNLASSSALSSAVAAAAGGVGAVEALSMVRSASSNSAASASGGTGTSPASAASGGGSAAGSPPAGASGGGGGGLPSSASAFGLASIGHSLSLVGAHALGESLSALGASSASRRRQSHDERLRRDWEAYAATLRAREEAEERRVRDIVDACAVEVVEVSAKDGWGIEEVFWSIAERLIERREDIERRRTLRSRDSIVLREEDAVDTSKRGWCGC